MAWIGKGSLGVSVAPGLSPFTADLGNGLPFTCDLVVVEFVGWEGLTCSVTDDAGLTYLPLTARQLGDVFVQMFYAHGAALAVPAHNNITFTFGPTANSVKCLAEFWTGSNIAAPLQAETGSVLATPAAPMVLGPFTPDHPEPLVYYVGATSITSTGADSGLHPWPYVHNPDGSFGDGQNPTFFEGGANWSNHFIQSPGAFPAPESFSLDGWTASDDVAFALAMFRSNEAVPPPPGQPAMTDVQVWR